RRTASLRFAPFPVAWPRVVFAGMTKFASLRKAVFPLQVVLATLAGQAFAHTTGLRRCDLNFGTNGLAAVITMAGSDLTLALAHLESTTPTDANHDGKLTAEEIAASVERLRKLAAECLVLEFDGHKVTPGPAR